MKRALLFFLAVGVVLLTVGSGVYIFRMRARTTASPPAMTCRL